MTEPRAPKQFSAVTELAFNYVAQGALPPFEWMVAHAPDGTFDALWRDEHRALFPKPYAMLVLLLQVRRRRDPRLFDAVQAALIAYTLHATPLTATIVPEIERALATARRARFPSIDRIYWDLIRQLNRAASPHLFPHPPLEAALQLLRIRDTGTAAMFASALGRPTTTVVARAIAAAVPAPTVAEVATAVARQRS